ncbi:MAG: hypothetical protein PHU51_01735 [Candidatus Nanoarchaeia archaeon]|nr:hypothetical protein [Candidatus Nanoarchaeia archaeon]
MTDLNLESNISTRDLRKALAHRQYSSISLNNAFQEELKLAFITSKLSRSPKKLTFNLRNEYADLFTDLVELGKYIAENFSSTEYLNIGEIAIPLLTASKLTKKDMPIISLIQDRIEYILETEFFKEQGIDCDHLFATHDNIKSTLEDYTKVSDKKPTLVLTNLPKTTEKIILNYLSESKLDTLMLIRQNPKTKDSSVELKKAINYERFLKEHNYATDLKVFSREDNGLSYILSGKN